MKFHNFIKPQNNFIIEIKYIEISKIKKTIHNLANTEIKVLFL